MPKPPEDLRKRCAAEGRVDVVLGVTADLAERIERYRAELTKRLGSEPARSAVLRDLVVFALDMLERSTPEPTADEDSACVECGSALGDTSRLAPSGVVCGPCFENLVRDEDEADESAEEPDTEPLAEPELDEEDVV